MRKEKKKKKIRLVGVLLILLFVYLLTNIIYYVFTLPVKNIIVEGNVLLSEAEILDSANINSSKPMFKISRTSIKKGVKKLDLVNKVVVHKSIKGIITISIEENKILFYNVLSNKYVLSNKKEISDLNYPGIPTLVNYVPSDNYDKFIEELSKIDLVIINMISEIEYSPNAYDDVITDVNRFLLRMNDGNSVYINISNMERLNKYREIYSVTDSKGILYLDSTSKNYIFKKYPVKDEN